MNKFLRYLYPYKEYLLLIFLVTLGLFLQVINERQGSSKARAAAFGSVVTAYTVIESITGLLPENEEIENLRIQNARLNLELNMLREISDENTSLRSLLSLRDTIQYPFVAASIISKLSGRIRGYYIINKGEQDGIFTGMPVINESGLIGVVSIVAGNFATVRTLRNPKLRIAVKNQRSGIGGILEWDGIRLIIKNIPTNYDFQAGDRVVTSEFSTLVPPSIPVGVAAEKEEKISGILSNIHVIPFANFDKARNLFVLKVTLDKEAEQMIQQAGNQPL